MCLFQMGTGACRQVRAACAAQRHFFVGIAPKLGLLSNKSYGCAPLFPRRSVELIRKLAVRWNGKCLFVLIQSSFDACQQCEGALGARHRDYDA